MIALGLVITTTGIMSGGCGSEERNVSNSAGGEDGVFTIAYAPNESTTESADARKGLAEDLSKELGCDVEEIQASDYNAIIEALRTGKADMAYMGSQALALGVERTDLEPIVMKAEEGDPEKAIYHSVLITGSGNDEIHSFDDLAGKTTANTLASTYAALAESYGATAIGVDDLAQTIELLRAGRVDATLNAEVTYYDYIKQHPDAPIKVAALTDTASEVSIPVRKGDDTRTLLAAINEAIEAMRASGELSALSEKYFGSDISGSDN